MATALYVKPGDRSGVEDFCAEQRIGLKLSPEREGAVRLRNSSSRCEAKTGVLYRGGWIGCVAARSMAGRLGISPGEMGLLLNHLDIRIRHCELGCF